MKKLFRSGEPFIWLTGGALASSLIIVVGLVTLILTSGLGFFWPANVLRMTLRDGTVITGLVVERERVPGKTGDYRIKVQVANRDLYGADFQWMDEATIARRDHPADVVLIERTEWGLLIGTIREVRESGRTVVAGPQQGLAELERRLPDAARVVEDVLAWYREPVQDYVRRRHAHYQLYGKRNPEIFALIADELAIRLVAAPSLSERQLRRIVYG